ncbi:MAG: type II secretion system GspH family protein [Candidatus Nomurabacteria bacterium]|nr:type II secretion system GspH family protein [Candidatus Nomurabacteria bacterium]
MQKKHLGFTLIEVLLVVALIAILAGIVIVAINPGKQISDTNNTQRSADVATILNGVYQYAIDNKGSLPSSISATETEICRSGGACTGLIDLGVLVVNETYLVEIPIDPLCDTTAGANCSVDDGAGYTIVKTSNNRVKISAPDAENGITISVTR